MPLLKALALAAAFLAMSLPGAASAQSTADLSVRFVGSPNPVRRNETITWTITVTNLGPAQATGVKLGAGYGSDASAVSATTTQGTCALFDFSLGSIASGGQVTATAVVQTFGGDGDSLSVTASSTSHDPNLKNNSARGSVRIVGESQFREFSGTFCAPIGGVATGGGGTAAGSQPWLTTALLAVGLLAAAAMLVRR